MLELIARIAQSDLVIGFVAPVFLLGFLIFVHESGHFLVAKLFGVGVERFSFGFGPRIFGKTYAGTEYRLSWIPLGGYVKMVGDDPFEEVHPSLRELSFLHKPVWQRLLIVLAGPMFNLLLPIFLFSGIYSFGSPEPTAFVGTVVPGSAAEIAGVQVGERIVAVGATPVRFFSDLEDALADLPLGATTTLDLEKEGVRRRISVALKIEASLDYLGEAKEQNRLGVEPHGPRSVIGVVGTPPSALSEARLLTGDLVTAVNGNAIKWWYELETALREAAGTPARFAIQREGKTLELTIAPDPNFLLISGPLTSSLSINTVTETHPGAVYGIFPHELFIKELQPGKPAELAGIIPGDMVYSINGTLVKRWHDVKRKIEAPAEEMKHMVLFRSGEAITLDVMPEVVTGKDRLERAKKEGQIGIRQSLAYGADEEVLQLSFGAAVVRGTTETFEFTVQYLQLLKKLFTGDIPLSDSLGGPISIVTVAAKSAWISIYAYIKIMVVISVSLGVVNLLPVPLLDGGHILFFTLEFLRGRPVSMRFREISQQVGLLFILVLMVYAFTNDVRMLLLK